MTNTPHIQLVLDILKNEVNGDVASALAKMANDYKMTWVYEGKNGELFPATGENMKDELDDVYPIRGRKYDIRNIAEGEDVVMIEVIESYPDPDTGKVYRTPQVIVLEFADEKIRTGRHYTDPRLSYQDLTEEQLQTAFRDTATKIIIS